MTDTARLTTALELARAGTILGPSHGGYDEARRSFNGLLDRRPLAIVQPADHAAVEAAVRVAIDHDIAVAVRGGGHSVAGHGVAEGALTIDLRRMRHVHVDPDARNARVEGGALWEDVDPAAAVHGLAMPGGTFGDTGVGGLALGGGIGWLIGVAGLTCDRLVRATVVNGLGETVIASEQDDAELLWALRGGGGNFGVVTAFEFSLLPVGPMTYSRHRWDFADAEEVLLRAAGAIADMPDELSVFIVIGADDRTPDESTLRIALDFGFLGDVDDAKRAVAPFIGGSPIDEETRPISYLELQALNGTMDFGLRNYWTGHFVPDLTPPLVGVLLEAIERRPSQIDFVLIEAISGVARRIPSDSAAFGQRAASWNVSVLAIWDDPADDEQEMAWARTTSRAMAPYSLTGGGYVNYSPPDEPAERVRAAYGDERFARLQAVKRRHDPNNRFRFNHNIPPA